MTDIEIKPCPHCGNDAALCQKNHELDTWYVACTICGATNGRQGKDATVQAWNARTYQEEINKASHIIVEDAAETARLRAALASAIEERDEALKYRDFAMADKENIGFLKRLWEQECGYYRARWWASQRAEERSRRTIRALVAACRVTRLAAVGFAALAGVGPRRVRDEIRFGVNQAKKAERGQAGKE